MTHLTLFFPEGLVEIWPVDTGCVAIKGVASSRFLCMERNGKLYGSVGFTLILHFKVFCVLKF